MDDRTNFDGDLRNNLEGRSLLVTVDSPVMLRCPTTRRTKHRLTFGAAVRTSW